MLHFPLRMFISVISSMTDHDSMKILWKHISKDLKTLCRKVFGAGHLDQKLLVKSYFGNSCSKLRLCAPISSYLWYAAYTNRSFRFRRLPMRWSSFYKIWKIPPLWTWWTQTSRASVWSKSINDQTDLHCRVDSTRTQLTCLNLVWDFFKFRFTRFIQN